MGALERQLLLVFGLLYRTVFGRVAVFDVMRQGGSAAQTEDALVAVAPLLMGAQPRLSFEAHGTVCAPVGAFSVVLGLQRFFLLEAHSDCLADVLAGRTGNVVVFFVCGDAAAGLLVHGQKVMAIEHAETLTALFAQGVQSSVCCVDFTAELADFVVVYWWRWWFLSCLTGDAGFVLAKAASARKRRGGSAKCLR
jgi:hypothetical protein